MSSAIGLETDWKPWSYRALYNKRLHLSRVVEGSRVSLAVGILDAQ